MSKGRYRRLYESFVFGQRICSISREAEMFFWRIYVIADDYGNFEIDPKTLVVRAGGLRKLKQTEVQTWIKEMEVAGLIKLYQVGKKWYGHFLSFSDLQVPSGPAQNPDFGMLRHCPESPWDKSSTHSIQRDPRGGHAQVIFEMQEREKKESDIKKEKSKEVLSFGIKTNTKTDTIQNTTNRYPSPRATTAQNELFENPEDLNGEMIISDPRLYDFIQEVFKHWQKKCDHPLARLSPERVRLLKSRFKDSSLEEMKQAIEGCASSDFHMGRQPNNPVKYNDLTLICRNRSKVEFFMEKVTFNPKLDEKAERKRKSDEARAKWHAKK